MKVYGIMALSDDNVIGIDGKLPWTCPEDLDNFKNLTMGHMVLVGSRTLKTLPNLPGRRVVCLSKQRDARSSSVTLHVPSIEKAVHLAEVLGHEKLFIAGGLQVYKHFYQVERFYGRVQAAYAGTYRTRIHQNILDINKAWGECTRIPLDLENDILNTHHPQMITQIFNAQNEVVGTCEYLAYGKSK